MLAVTSAEIVDIKPVSETSGGLGRSPRRKSDEALLVLQEEATAQNSFESREKEKPVGGTADGLQQRSGLHKGRKRRMAPSAGILYYLMHTRGGTIRRLYAELSTSCAVVHMAFVMHQS